MTQPLLLHKVEDFTMMQYIRQEVNHLTKKYDTQDPYVLCSALHIILRYAAMGKDPDCCKGFMYVKSRIISITLNSDLSEELQRVILAHEIGHAVLHSKEAGVYGFHDVHLFDQTASLEYEANFFAAELLLTDSDVLDVLNDDTSFFDAAKMLYVPAELLDFKWRVLKRNGYKIGDSPITVCGDFLKDVVRHEH